MESENKFYAMLLLMLFQGSVWAQQGVIELNNSSFADVIRYTKPFHDWYVCDNVGIIPVANSKLYTTNPRLKPESEEFYWSLTVREDGQCITLGQHLQVHLKANECYLWMLRVRYADYYMKFSDYTNRLTSFKKPARLIIWGGTNQCIKKEILAQSAVITNSDWQWHQFYLLPGEDYSHIMIEAYFESNEGKYNGNVLLERVSPIYTIDCTTNALLLEADTVQSPVVNDLAQLEATVRAYGKKIRFTEAAIPALQFGYYFHESGELVWGESNLYSLAQAMKKQPEYRLVIGVPTESNTYWRDVSQLITKEFKNLGLWLNDFKVRAYNPAEKGWLWKPGEGGVIMRIERK